MAHNKLARAEAKVSRRPTRYVLALAMLFSALVAPPSSAAPLKIEIVSPLARSKVSGVVAVKARVRSRPRSVIFEWSPDSGTTWQPIEVDVDRASGWTARWDTNGFRGVTTIRATVSNGLDFDSDRIKVRVVGPPQPGDPTPPSLSGGLVAYSGFGTWVDVPSEEAWRRPEKTVNKIAKMGVQTLFLQTSNYRHDEAIVYRWAAKQILAEAHERGIQVVAWYLPALNRRNQDFNRVKKAIDMEGPNGERFDSFALDIEATVIEDIERRNRRTIALAERIRNYVGIDYSLGAIVPDVHSLYWPGFPYEELGQYFNVFLPMSYFTYRTSGYRNVHRYIEVNVRAIRRRTGDRAVPIHVIGGLAGIASNREVDALLDACFARKVQGSSLYDFSITQAGEWKRMRRAQQLE